LVQEPDESREAGRWGLEYAPCLGQPHACVWSSILNLCVSNCSCLHVVVAYRFDGVVVSCTSAAPASPAMIGVISLVCVWSCMDPCGFNMGPIVTYLPYAGRSLPHEACYRGVSDAFPKGNGGGEGFWWAIHGATLAEGMKRAWQDDTGQQNRNVQRSHLGALGFCCCSGD